MSIPDLKQSLMELDLSSQVANAVDYVYQNSTNVTENMKKIPRLMMDARTICDAIRAENVPNLALQQSLKDLLEHIEDIEGKEGCPPVNWKQTQMLRDFLNEVSKNAVEHGAQIVESYEHWADTFENGIYMALYMQKW